MKKLLIVALAMSLAGAALFAKPVELVYTMTAVPTDAHAGAMRVFKETVERVSGGEIKVLAYDSASLFKQEQEVSAVRSGQADMTATAAPWLTDGSPWLSMFTAGYMFKSYDHMTKVMNGEIGKAAFERVAKEQGIRPLGAQYLGTRQINLVKDMPVKTPADLKGVKLRMPNSESWLFLGTALGANPTPVSFSELYMALQTKTVDGQDNPLPSDKNAKFYEVTKSITITNHIVDSVWPAINEAKWQSLTAQQKAWVMEGVKAGIKYCDETNLKAEAELVEFFKGAGLKIYYADIDAFSSHVLKQYLDSKFAKTWDMDLFKKVQAAAK
ncbi:MAG TPA: sialic acid TRAP transporter substrate-binding protein SiaP [Spirochaetales bacterium]|nr:sialic acid TRAP transporter substrate-binding protein SiaP [Spirochaetales bacterium]HRY56350.1 sialic acid TRAP transporter substrate-binding protein SiaP [Spirochaetia bacterium]HRZ65478.1 sialic acid TRAP transporter substrate-binding protein SiaP [Spirochaetia bacterium]